MTDTSPPALTDLLHAAVTAVGGTERAGQVAMAEAVAAAVDDNSHLLVQAGTGTGKSRAAITLAASSRCCAGIASRLASAAARSSAFSIWLDVRSGMRKKCGAAAAVGGPIPGTY